MSTGDRVVGYIHLFGKFECVYIHLRLSRRSMMAIQHIEKPVSAN